MSAIYIHIPYCKQACNYCDFHFSTNTKNTEVMTSALVKEIDLRHDYLKKRKLSSIYFGGGTPSLLERNELERVLETINKYFTLETDAELTLEANPDDINKKNLTDWKSLGINRLSIGLQSFNNHELKWMNRAHTAEQSVTSVMLAQDSGFDNISIDLIYGSKFQNENNWLQTLTKATNLKVQHISSYNLTIEKKTVLGTNYMKSKEPAIDEELSSRQFLKMTDFLQAQDFLHYEISNFGKKNFFAKHNSNYWLQQHYLGLGPSAHSFNGLSRQWNVKSNNNYIQALEKQESFYEVEMLQPKDRYNEYVLTRLRTIWGCNLSEIESFFGKQFSEHFEKEIASKKEFIVQNELIYTLNSAGKLQADGIASDLFFL